MPVTARTVAPLATMGLTWAARKSMTRAYASGTGHEPPAADDREVPLRNVILWAVASAVVMATIDVMVNRTAARIADRNELPAQAHDTSDGLAPA